MHDMTGWTKKQRAERRRMYDDIALHRAKERERSIKCAPPYEKHATNPGGCNNDGSSCLCECHDPGAPLHVEDGNGGER